MGKSILEYIEALPREFIYTLLLICLSLPLIRPIGLPLPVSARIKEFHEYVENLPDGAYVFVGVDYGVSALPAFEPFMIACMHDLFSRNVKVVFATLYTDGPISYRSAIEKVNPDAYGKVYGEDYVFLGYVPGGETARKALAEDLHAAVPADFYGTPIGQIPMLQGIKGALDFDLLISMTPSGDVSIGWIRQWVTPYGIKYLSVVLAMMMPTMEPYYPEQVKALCGADKGGEYEFLLGKPGEGIKKADSFSLGHIMVIIFVVLGNIAYFTLRLKKRG